MGCPVGGVLGVAVLAPSGLGIRVVLFPECAVVVFVRYASRALFGGSRCVLASCLVRVCVCCLFSRSGCGARLVCGFFLRCLGSVMAAARSFSSGVLSSVASALVARPVVATPRALPVPSFVRAAGRVSVSAPVEIFSAVFDAGRGRVVLSTSSGDVWCVLKYAALARGVASLDGAAIASYLNRLSGRVVRLHTALGYSAFPSNGVGYFAAISE